MHESHCNVSTCLKDKPILRLSNSIKYVLCNTGTSLRKASERIGSSVPCRSTAT